ncbi:hypothetical protein TRFO_39910 [Tritrichomonas foetus]|uniref:BAR domain-containing protein n=1 Tax=Tritrichomonas foetus TaxID=1144522 RepID=A0A1J4J5E4_9EUKA|nr:hypothetical protein TRFO_39910 [Tritrichomonas foetus]|eukprot:OHS93913.1 hypothetical protein TRFO_39910 [Tritrichomonas foetus]
MRSLFNKITQFPEYHNMDGALEDALRAQVKEKAEFDAAQGQAYSEFSRKQTNESVSEVLFKIDEQLKSVQDAQKASNEALPKVRSELTRLRPLNDEIRNKKKNRDAIKTRSEKSAKAADRAEAKLETLRVKNPSSPDFTRAQDDYDQCLRQKQADITALEEREAVLVTETKEYKKELFKVVIAALGQFVSAKQQSAASLVSIGDQISELGGQIPPYDDPSIEVLQTQLQAYRSEPLE